MRYLWITFVLVFSINHCYAQDVNRDFQHKNTLLGEKPFTGAFIGVSVKSGETNNQQDMWLGGEVAGTFDHNLSIGLAGYGLVSTVKGNNMAFNNRTLHYQSGYGGLFVEPAAFSNRVLNVSFPTVLGAGGIAETIVGGVIDELDNFDLDENDFYHSDIFWVVEPGVALNLNISGWMKLGAGVSYRQTFDLNLPNTSSEVMNGINGNVFLKLGWF